MRKETKARLGGRGGRQKLGGQAAERKKGALISSQSAFNFYAEKTASRAADLRLLSPGFGDGSRWKPSGKVCGFHGTGSIQEFSTVFISIFFFFFFDY